MKYLTTILIAFSFFSCKQQSNMNTDDNVSTEPRTYILNWTSYDLSQESQNQVKYIFDGKELGQGEYGFWRVLAEVSKLPEGSTVSFEGEGPDMDPLGCGPIIYRPYFDYSLKDIDNEQNIPVFHILDLLAKEKCILIEETRDNPLSEGTYKIYSGAVSLEKEQ